MSLVLNWIDVTLQDIRVAEAYREYAYPDVLSPLYKKATTLRSKWGFTPARTLQLPQGVTLAMGAPWTVGYGYTHGVTPDTRFSKEMAEHKLREVFQQSVKDCLMLVPSFNTQPDAIKSVLADMCYNMGRARLGGFKNTLKYIDQRNYAQAAANMEKSLWYQQVGQRARKLVKRVRTQKLEE